MNKILLIWRFFWRKLGSWTMNDLPRTIWIPESIWVKMEKKIILIDFSRYMIHPCRFKMQKIIEPRRISVILQWKEKNEEIEGEPWK